MYLGVGDQVDMAVVAPFSWEFEVTGVFVVEVFEKDRYVVDENGVAILRRNACRFHG